MAIDSRYDEAWYDAFAESSRSSARVIAPQLLEWTGARSVVDVGCGRGVWLSVFQEIGLTDVFGLDGYHVAPDSLEIDAANFKARDLGEPLELARRYDLAISLELAEHLPAEAAEDFVKGLSKLAPVVAFSAAIPFQGGTGHLNEQWPSYWAELFSRAGKRVVDCLRAPLWSDERVSWWYAQNLLLFADDAAFEGNSALTRARAGTREGELDRVHPTRYLELAGQTESSPPVRAGRRIRELTRPLRRALGR